MILGFAGIGGHEEEAEGDGGRGRSSPRVAGQGREGDGRGSRSLSPLCIYMCIRVYICDLAFVICIFVTLVAFRLGKKEKSSSPFFTVVILKGVSFDPLRRRLSRTKKNLIRYFLVLCCLKLRFVNS